MYFLNHWFPGRLTCIFECYRSKNNFQQKKKKKTTDVIQAIRSNIIIHDIDIRRWALQVKLEDLTLFTASRTWLLKFKKAYGIVSRKVTKFVTRSSIDKEPELILSSHNFQEPVKSCTDRYGSENLYNSDQNGFNLELHSGRTLALKGNIWRVWT